MGTYTTLIFVWVNKSRPSAVPCSVLLMIISILDPLEAKLFFFGLKVQSPNQLIFLYLISRSVCFCWQDNKHMSCILFSQHLCLGPRFGKAVQNRKWLRNTHFVQPALLLHCSHFSFVCNLISSDILGVRDVIHINEMS